MPIDELDNFQGDLKTLDDESFKKLKGSIVKYGFSFPIFVWDGNILDGHQRLKAVKSLIEEGYTLDGDLLPVDHIEAKNEKEAAEKLLLINSRYAKIDQSGFDLFVENFDLDIADLSDMLDIPEVDFSFEDDDFEGNTDPDEVPEVEETPVTKMGDIWILGSHRLMCGDSTKIEDVERLMDGEKADMVFTDPPYGVAYVGKTKDKLTIESDDFDEKKLSEYVAKWFDGVNLATRDGAYWLATVPAGPLHEIFLSDWKSRGILRQVMVWVKDSMVLGHSEYHYRHEPILFGWKKGNRLKNKDRTKTTVWEFDRPKASREHPTMKPVELWSYGIKNHTKDNDILYEPFSGSGTTIIAAQQTGRKCYAMEISPQYVDVAIKRWQDFTGKDAVLERTGETFEMIKNAVTP